MNRQYAVAAIIGVVVILAALATPVFLGGPQRASRQAAAQAQAALGELERVSPVLPLAAQHVDAAALKDNDAALEHAATAASEKLNEVSTAAGQDARRATSDAERFGFTAPEEVRIGTGASGIRSSLETYADVVRENEQRLGDVIKVATDLSQNDASLTGPFLLGLAQQMRAIMHLNVATAIRGAQRVGEGELLALTARWKRDRSYADHYRSLDVQPIVAGLEQDQAEIATAREAAEARLAELKQQVETREQELAQATEEANAARAALEAHEAAGFKAGDESSFKAYQTQHATLLADVQQKQERELQLRFGARIGATLSGDDLENDALEGGEEMPSLEQLKWELATAEETVRRYTGATSTLADEVKYIQTSGAQAADYAQRYSQRIAELDAAQKQKLTEIGKTAGKALEEEGAALEAAEAAARAFRDAGQRLTRLVTDARSAQQERDPERKNARLSTIVSDPYLSEVADSAAADAQALVARIHAERLRANAHLLETVRVFAEINPDPTFEFDSAAYEEVVNTAREQGQRAAEEARSLNERLSRGPTATNWIPLGSLAAAQHLSAELDDPNAPAYLQQARESLQEAVKDRQQSPYLRPLLLFLEHLSPPGSSPSAAPAAEATEADPNNFFGTEEGGGN